MDGKGEKEVQDERRHERRDERAAGDDLLVEQVVEDVAERAGEHRDRPDGDERREATIAAGRLRVPARPEPGQREDERGDAERAERHEVDDEAAGEAEHRARDRAAQEPERDDDDEEKVGRAARDDERGDDHDLQQRGDEDDSAKPRSDRADAHPPRSVGTSTMTASSGAEVDVRVDLDLLEEVGVGLPDARDPPDRDPLRIQRAQRAGAPAGGDDLVAAAHDVLLADAVEHERLARAPRVAHDPGRAGSQVDGRGGRLLVGQQLDAGRSRGHPRDDADEAVGGHDRVVRRVRRCSRRPR